MYRYLPTDDVLSIPSASKVKKKNDFIRSNLFIVFGGLYATEKGNTYSGTRNERKKAGFKWNVVKSETCSLLVSLTKQGELNFQNSYLRSR